MTHKLQGLLDNLLNAVFDVHGKLFCGICGESLDPQRVGDIFYCVYWEQWRGHSYFIFPSGVSIRFSVRLQVLERLGRRVRAMPV